ncbi:hypothetical protein [Pseudomonas sp. Sample_22]|uniref:hypothetical protein n=1 Tax=Pseudomonas sp. Sample_22 TaxID=2448266 RepID=UPI0010327DCD|nr:hypothetical protein [Pseudomonas sp. Sample_22]
MVSIKMRSAWIAVIVSLMIAGFAHADLAKGTRAMIPAEVPLCNILSIDAEMTLLDAGVSKAVKGCTLNTKPQDAVLLMNYESSKMGKYSRWYLLDTEEETFIPNSMIK